MARATTKRSLVALGALLVAGGLVLLVTPGPSLVVLAIGALLLVIGFVLPREVVDR